MDDEVTRAARAKKGSPFLSTEQAAFYLGLSARKMQALRSTGGGPPFRRHVVTSAIISTISTTGRERPGTARAMPDCPGEAPQRRPGGPGPASMVLAALRRPASAAALLAALALAGTLVAPPRPLLFWNASPSSRTGLYAISKGGPARGDTAVAWAPEKARRLAASRHYLPATVPLVKRVAAVAGDRVCAAGNRILVNGRPAARRARDPSGRMLPWWSGCQVLQRGELFLLSPGSPDAFDGRYFGITHNGEVIGKARLLWRARQGSNDC